MRHNKVSDRIKKGKNLWNFSIMRIGCNRFSSKSSGLELALFVHMHVKGSEYEKGTGPKPWSSSS